MDPVELLLQQGSLGLIAAVFIWLYLAERKRSNELHQSHSDELRDVRERHYQQLDAVRQAQITREQEVARTLEEYGRSIVEAVERVAFLAEELRRFNRGKQ